MMQLDFNTQRMPSNEMTRCWDKSGRSMALSDRWTDHS